MARQYGISPGQSMAQYGHAGHAGKSPAQAHRDQRTGRETPQAQQHITGGAAPPAAVTGAPDFVRQPVGPGTTFPDYRSTVPQGFLQGIGNKFRDFTIKMRGYNEDENRPNTQAEYEAARQNRINQKRIQNITSRDIPWTEQTLQTLGGLGYQGDLSRSQIGSTPFDRYPPRVGTVVEDAAAGIRATDAAQGMIYPERRPFVPPAFEYEGMFPSSPAGPWTMRSGQGTEPYIEAETASYDEPERGWESAVSNAFTTGKKKYDKDFMPKPEKDYIDLSKSISSEDISGLTRTGTWQDQMGGQLMGDFKEATHKFDPNLDITVTGKEPNVNRLYKRNIDKVRKLLEQDDKRESGDIMKMDKKTREFNEQQLLDNEQDLRNKEGRSMWKPWTYLQDFNQGGYMRSRYSNGGRVGILAAF